MSLLSNPWAPWGIIQATANGRPVLTETNLWHLRATHPDRYEERDGARYVRLDRRYRLMDVPDRAYWSLEPAPEPAPRT